METINQRINHVVSLSNLTKTAFAKRINVSQAMVSMLCSGATAPSDRTIADICREFNVNPKWLREGEEPVFMPLPEEDTAYINDLLNELDNPFIETIKAIMLAYNESSPEDKKRIKDFAARFTHKMQKENRD